MTTFTKVPQAIEDVLESRHSTTSRRDFLKTSGALVVSFGTAGVTGPDSLAAAVGGEEAAAAQQVGPYPDPDFRQLDTWVAIHADNTATFYVGKTDCGQGTGTAFRQMMSDELDIAYTDTSLVMGSTDVTPDQGGSGGSDGIERDGWPMRPRGRRGPTGPAGDGLRTVRRAGGATRRQRRGDRPEVRPHQDSHLRRVDR